MSWDEYERLLRHGWQRVLRQSPPEGEIQRYMEKHPSLVPCPFGHHVPHHGVLFSQPEIPGLRTRHPDFMWLACTSSSFTATLIEIERPGKKWWNSRRGVPTPEFVQAQQQLAQWRSLMISLSENRAG